MYHCVLTNGFNTLVLPGKPQKDLTNSYDFSLLVTRVREKIRSICQNKPQPICKPQHIHSGEDILPQ